MAPRGVKTQYWDFVYNNETDETTSQLISMMEQSEWIEDAAFQHEVAPSTGMRHLQGWIKIKDNRQYKSYLLRSILNQGDWENKISFRPARNPKALKDYCKKAQAGAHGYWCKSEELEKKEQLARDELSKELSFVCTTPPDNEEEYDITGYDEDGNEIIVYYDSFHDYLNRRDDQYASTENPLNSDLKALALSDEESDDTYESKLSGQTLSDSLPNTAFRPTAGVIDTLSNYHDMKYEANHQELVDLQPSFDQKVTLSRDHPSVCRFQWSR